MELGVGKIMREGSDVTLVGWGAQVHVLMKVRKVVMYVCMYVCMYVPLVVLVISSPLFITGLHYYSVCIVYLIGLAIHIRIYRKNRR